MKKNDRVQLNITSLSMEGFGIGRVDDMAVFVANTAVGDIVSAHIIKVKSRYAIGKLIEVIVPSEDRKEVDCEAFKSCGGCAFRHITYESELKAKQAAVENVMKRIGGVEIAAKSIIPSPIVTRYRNKAQYPISNGKNGIMYGFYARHSHRVIENSGCVLQPYIFDEIMSIIKKWADENNISAYDERTGKGLLRHILLRNAEQTEQIMVVAVINGDSLPFAEKLVTSIKLLLGGRLASLCYNINKKDTNVVMGEKTVLVYGQPTITDIICGTSLEISPESFYQVNRSAAELLYKKATEYVEKSDRVIVDLFCGTGAIGLSLLNICGNDGKTLYGVEIVPSAVENAKKNAEKNGFKNCKFICGDAAEAAETLKSKGIKPDIVILDPPRKGCAKELLNTVAFGFSPKKIIYISCDPATLARDSKILKENGYILQQYTPVDLFPATSHCETVVLLSKGEVDSKKVRVEFSLEDMDMSDFQDNATYAQIKDYVLEHSGLKVSNLYISQIKRKCGIEVGKNYNLPKSEDSRQPQCPPEKEKAIREAFEYFGLI